MIRHTLLSILLISSSASVSAAQTPFTLDLGHAHFGWEIDHFGFSNTIGQFRTFDGEFLVDEDRMENSSIRFVVQTDSVDSNHIGRDNHLRAAELLNTDAFPTIEFVSTEIAMLEDNNGSITGDLTFLGTTMPLTLQFTLTDDAAFAEFLPRYDQRRALGFEAKGRVDRLAHGLTALDFPGSPLGQYIDLNIHFDLVDCNGAPANNIPCQYRRNDTLEFPNE